MLRSQQKSAEGVVVLLHYVGIWEQTTRMLNCHELIKCYHRLVSIFNLKLSLGHWALCTQDIGLGLLAVGLTLIGNIVVHILLSLHRPGTT